MISKRISVVCALTFSYMHAFISHFAHHVALFHIIFKPIICAIIFDWWQTHGVINRFKMTAPLVRQAINKWITFPRHSAASLPRMFVQQCISSANIYMGRNSRNFYHYMKHAFRMANLRAWLLRVLSPMNLIMIRSRESSLMSLNWSSLKAKLY